MQHFLPKSGPILELLSSRATSIREVVERLTAIMQWASANDSRLGYFPALYRKVTMSVQTGIHQGSFDDGSRMERFDVIFANRYFDALQAYCSGRNTPQSWKLAFESAGEFWPIVLQHLVLGVNAHINFDLGISAAATMKGCDLEDIRGDFNKINSILASLVGEVQNELAEVWMLLKLMNRFLGSIDDSVINFSMERARDEAWKSASTFWALPESVWPQAEERQDLRALRVGSVVRNPGAYLSAVTKIVRLGEVRSVRRVIEILS